MMEMMNTFSEHRILDANMHGAEREMAQNFKAEYSMRKGKHI